MKSLKDSLNSEIKEFHVIVHEKGIIGYTPKEKIREKKVMEEINRIKKKENYLIIGKDDDAARMHPKMPPPSSNLKILVSGAYKKFCCDVHLEALRELGYNAEFHEKGCYDSDD